MACNIEKKLDVNNFNLSTLLLILLLHYLVKCASRSLAVNNNEFILGNASVGSKIYEKQKNH